MGFTSLDPKLPYHARRPDFCTDCAEGCLDSALAVRRRGVIVSLDYGDHLIMSRIAYRVY